MSFFFTDQAAQRVAINKATDYSTFHELECKVCPLNSVYSYNPKMPASGSKNPDIYILGEAPGKEEDQHGNSS